jgi:hypothetical protein
LFFIGVRFFKFRLSWAHLDAGSAAADLEPRYAPHSGKYGLGGLWFRLHYGRVFAWSGLPSVIDQLLYSSTVALSNPERRF